MSSTQVKLRKYWRVRWALESRALPLVEFRTSSAPGEAQTLSEAADFASSKREFEVCMADLTVVNKNASSDAQKFATDHTDKKLFRNY